MSRSFLSELGLSAEQAARLPNKDLQRLLRFLVKWEDWQGALDCLDAHGPSTLVSIYDLRAEALSGAGRHDEAIATMQARLALKESPSALIQSAQIYLAAGEAAAAEAILQSLVPEGGLSATGWALLGDAHLAQDRLPLAEAAYLRSQKLSPDSRTALIGLTEIERRRGNPVASAAYAVRAFTVEEGQYAPSVPLLRKLRDYFRGTADANRLADAEGQLAARLAHEFDELKAALMGVEPEERRAGGVEEQGSAKLITSEGAGLTKADHEKRKPSHGAGETAARGKGKDASSAPAPLHPSAPPLLHSSTPDAVPVSEAERAEIEAAARRYFGFPSLLPAQAEIMACVRRGENVLAVLPTGGGKSLCYQLPALMEASSPPQVQGRDPGRNGHARSGGVTLVISPLIALMKDQLDNLPEAVRGRAIAINSSLEGRQLREAVAALRSGRYTLAYAAPERLRQPPFLHALRTAGLTRLVIDEAHCVSIWGHDFRPDYLAIARVAHDLGDPPILALTATAPPRVREDMQRRLFGDGRQVAGQPGPVRTGAAFRAIATDTYRPNLTLSAVYVRDEDEKLGRLVDLCRSLAGSGIVYAPTRRRCEELSAMLQRQGVEASYYHAGLDGAARAAIQEGFMAGKARVIVATVAFGMGIDKPDIRFIIHFGLPDSVEAYYQEAGRAGRDGQPAQCILLYGTSDRAVLTRHAREGLMTVDYLRAVYAAASRRLKRRSPQVVPFVELLAECGGEETELRVALSILEQTGLLQRDYDLPATVGLRWAGRGSDGYEPPPWDEAPWDEPEAGWGGFDFEDDERWNGPRRPNGAPGAPGWRPATALEEGASGRSHGETQAPVGDDAAGGLLLDRLVEVAGLVPGQQVTRDLLDLAVACDLPPAELEQRLLALHGAASLDYVPGGRDLVLALPPPPPDAAQRIDSLLSQYAAIQQQRVTEIWDYARTTRCRHGYLANYLGGQPRRSCAACDNCLSQGGLPVRSGEAGLGLPGTSTPDLAEQLRLVLAALAERGFGRRNLALLLRGDPAAPGRDAAPACFGALSFRSETAIGKLVDALVGAGYVEERMLGHGGVALGLTPVGRRVLALPAAASPLASLIKPPPAAPQRWSDVAGPSSARQAAAGPAAARPASSRPEDGQPGGRSSGAAPAPQDGALTAAARDARPARAPVFDPDDPAQYDLFMRLRSWRTAEARSKAVPPYIVFSDTVLQALAAARPGSREELAAVKGIGPAKLAEYGDALLDLIRR